MTAVRAPSLRVHLRRLSLCNAERWALEQVRGARQTAAGIVIPCPFDLDHRVLVSRSTDELGLVECDHGCPTDAVVEELGFRREDVLGLEEPTAVTTASAVTVEDFYALMPSHTYMFVPSREPWPAASVNARIAPILDGDTPKKAAAWLDEHRPVEQLTWAPGEPMVIRDKLIAEGGWMPRPACSVFNLYRPPQQSLGDPSLAGPWLDHLERIYPREATHIAMWLAQRVQRPGEKLNHALVLGGHQGIGKDTILEPVKYAIGPWNFQEVSPDSLLGRFNGFVKSVILRVSEARDLGEMDRYAFYEHLKRYTAAPPDVLRCDEKNLREYAVPNVCGVILTTNHKTDGIYLPADDRRHFVAWSDAMREGFSVDYFRQFYRWYADGGIGHVTAYLTTLDLSSFDAKAPPPKTAAFWDIVDANRAPEDAELADALERLGRPPATTLAAIAASADAGFGEWLRDRRNSRQIPHRLQAVGYEPVRNTATSDGRWKIAGKNVVVYVQRTLDVPGRIEAATHLAAWNR